MAATKECPSCGTEVPESANRCKVCFHDFTEIPPPKSSPLILLAAIALVVVMAVGALAYVMTLPVSSTIHLDPESESIIFVTKYRYGEETETLAWSRVGKLEHVVTRAGEFELLAVDLDGRRWVIESSNAGPIRGNAERYAEMLDKPLDFVDNTPAGFRSDAETP